MANTVASASIDTWKKTGKQNFFEFHSPSVYAILFTLFKCFPCSFFMKILLHVCCAPCATHCVTVLKDMGHDVTLFFSNANIAPQAEYNKRLEAVKILTQSMSVPLIVDAVPHSTWLPQVAQGFELEKERGLRCTRCFRFSLERTYAAMVKDAFDSFTTTLSVSPHKHTQTLFDVGRSLDPDRFFAFNFKKNNGFQHSLQLAADLGLYRQDYCGCEFSANSKSSL